MSSVSPQMPYKGGFSYRDILWYPYTTPELLQRCEKFEFRAEDIIVATVPRSGTTITQEVVWHIVHHDEMEKDKKQEGLLDRFPCLELNYFLDDTDSPCRIGLLEGQEGGRLIKTHLPYFMLRDQVERVGARMIVTMRNPKDNAVARYHFHRNVRQIGWDGSWSDFLNLYLSGRTYAGDFFDNNLQWWSLRNRPNVLILQFEDLVKKPQRQIQRIASFLGVDLSIEEVDVIAHNTSFNVMSENELVNTPLNDKERFLRKGKIGEWRKMFSEGQNEAMDKLIEEKLNGTDLTFQYE